MTIPETGQALSEAVAREVMGWEQDGNNWRYKGTILMAVRPTLGRMCWRPHDDIAQAIEAAEHLRATCNVGWEITRPLKGDEWGAAVLSPKSLIYCVFINGATTPSEALCRAILAFVRARKETR